MAEPRPDDERTEPQRPVVTCHPLGTELRPEDGECVLDAAWRADVPLASSCGGQGVCGSCAVAVLRGAENAGELDVVEQGWRIRNTPPEGIRLTCRMKVTGDVTISTTYW